MSEPSKQLPMAVQWLCVGVSLGAVFVAVLLKVLG